MAKTEDYNFQRSIASAREDGKLSDYKFPNEPMTKPALSPDHCRARQTRLRAVLAEKRLDGALLTDARHVHCFCGFWTPLIFPVALWIGRDGASVLSAATPPPSLVAADEIEVYQATKTGTLVEDLNAAALEPLRSMLRGKYLGCEVFPPSLGSGAYEVIGPQLLRLRRAKDPDEIAMIRWAIRAAERVYARARQILVPGANEVEIFADLCATAIAAAGEPIGELGNDFQCNGAGGAPRDHPIAAGEQWALDIAVSYRGYRCDLCRTFCIGGAPSDDQIAAHARVLQSLRWFEANARAGSSGHELYRAVFEQLDGFRGWRFPHHLGHGTGLSPHEAPRLNPHWDDTLQVGDVIAVEPGLYGTELRNGVRLEDDFLVTQNGLEKLSTVDLDL